MAEKKFFWFKLNESFFEQREMKKLRRIAGGDTFTIIYLKLQLLSLRNAGEIYFEETEDDIFEQMSLELDEEIEDIKMTLAYMNNNGLAEVEDQVISLIKTKELIGITSDSTLRSQKSRAKNAVKSLMVNEYATTLQQLATKSNIDIERERDIEIIVDLEKKSEKEKEKDPKKGKKNEGVSGKIDNSSDGILLPRGCNHNVYLSNQQLEALSKHAKDKYYYIDKLSDLLIKDPQNQDLHYSILVEYIESNIEKDKITGQV